MAYSRGSLDDVSKLRAGHNMIGASFKSHETQCSSPILNGEHLARFSAWHDLLLTESYDRTEHLQPLPAAAAEKSGTLKAAGTLRLLISCIHQSFTGQN